MGTNKDGAIENAAGEGSDGHVLGCGDVVVTAQVGQELGRVFDVRSSHRLPCA